MSVISAGAVGYPIATFLRLPKSMTQAETLEVPLADLADNVAVWGERMGRQIVILLIDGEPRAFDGACPHLGCVVQWDANALTFKCPCHGAFFNDQGEPTGGPVNAPLKPVKFEVKDGVLEIT